ncbi:hypothetical protein Tco_0763967 [Tanacetum coccineum]
MDDPNITMEEYIRLEEEKARRHGKVYNWETTTYGKIWYDEDVYDLRSVETEFPAIISRYDFPAIVYNDALKSKSDFLTEPTISIQHIDEFNLKDETSLSECDEEETKRLPGLEDLSCSWVLSFVPLDLQSLSCFYMGI